MARNSGHGTLMGVVAALLAAGALVLIAGLGGPRGRTAPVTGPGDDTVPAMHAAHNHAGTNNGPAATEDSHADPSPVARPGPAPAAATLRGLAAPGRGHPTEFLADRPAVLHVADRQWPLPCTLWFDDGAAPDGETPVAFRMRRGGSGTYDVFVAGDGGREAPCRFTDADGRPLAVLNVRFSIDELDGGRTRSTFRLDLARP